MCISSLGYNKRHLIIKMAAQQSMFNLKPSNTTKLQQSERHNTLSLRTSGNQSRSPSPLQRSAGMPDTPRPNTSYIHQPNRHTGDTSGGRTSNTSMFDLSKRPIENHGFIPGARPRPLDASMTHPINAPHTHISDEIIGAGRKRTPSNEPKETKRSSSASSQTRKEDIKEADEDIFKSIPVGSQKISLQEIKKLLEGYVALPKSFWESALVYRQHIRYTRLKDNMFVRGGFIIGFGKQRGRATITLANGFDPKKRGYYVWVIGFDGIGSLFVKRDSLPTNPTT